MAGVAGEVGTGDVIFEDGTTFCSSELILKFNYTVAKFRVTAWRDEPGVSSSRD